MSKKDKEKDGIGKFKWEMILTALVYVVIGVLLVMYPTSIAKTFCYTVAIILSAFGVIKLIVYAVRKDADDMPKTGLITGIFFLIIGLSVAVMSRIIISSIPFILGILIAVSGFSKLTSTMEVKKANSDYDAKKMYILAAINIVIGLLLALNPFRAAAVALVILGICLIITGVSDIISSIFFYRMVSNQIKEMQALEQEYKEVK